MSAEPRVSANRHREVREQPNDLPHGYQLLYRLSQVEPAIAVGSVDTPPHTAYLELVQNYEPGWGPRYSGIKDKKYETWRGLRCASRERL